MLINEIENIVGLTKKSIRYYEENGLLTPKRNKDNDYRVYDEDDIKKLKVIKFLRELGVPIRDLKRLNDGTFILQECMKERILKIEHEEENYQKVKDMCLEIAKSNETYEGIDITSYFQNFNVLNKEGFTMRDISTSKKKKIIGAIMSSLIFSFWFIVIGGMITYFQFTEVEKMPWVAYFIFLGILLFPLVGMCYNLIIRIKEINGGEEDEASKY